MLVLLLHRCARFMHAARQHRRPVVAVTMGSVADSRALSAVLTRQLPIWTSPVCYLFSVAHEHSHFGGIPLLVIHVMDAINRLSPNGSGCGVQASTGTGRVPSFWLQ